MTAERRVKTAWVEVDRETGPSDELYSITERLAVPGGWIYRTEVRDAAPSHVALVFVPDRGEGGA